MHVPGWHEATKQLQQEGKLQMVGILQEQHPDRARLFMQWKQMDWPLLVDSYNRLEVPYVPITLAIDEHGVIRAINRRMQEAGEVAQNLVSRRYAPPAGDGPAKPASPDVSVMRPPTSAEGSAWRAYGDALAVWGGAGRLGESIDAYQRVVSVSRKDAMAHFRLGVAYRKRYDSDNRQANDFRLAVEHWTTALEIDPNQYIFRRRIQQYGPRLDKPYPFYNWVITARREIEARGETPMTLAVEPGGAEFTTSAKTFEASEGAPPSPPDPERRILDDDGQFIRIETVTVPDAIAPGASARVHVVFRPVLEAKAHWNNEVDPLILWVDSPRAWQADSRWHTAPNPPEPVTQETRKVEFEIRTPEGARPGTYFVPAYALYYVCEDVTGVCMYRRQNVSIEVTLKR